MLNNALTIAQQILLTPNNLTETQLQQVLTQALQSNIDYADLYLQYAESEAWEIEEGIIKKGSFNIEQGAGIRSISGDKTGFAHTDNLILTAMLDAAKNSSGIVRSGKTGIVASPKTFTPPPSLYPALNPLQTFSAQQKIEILKNVDAIARKCDNRVTQVNASLAGAYKVIFICSNDGVWNADIRPVVHLNVTVIVTENGHQERGTYGGGRRSGYEIFPQENLDEKYAKEAVRAALINLAALPTPAGMMPVILGNGWPAVMLHEAVGHGLEADFNRKKQSVYTNKQGTRVATEQVSVVDQGNIPGGRRGSLNIDDEGTPTQYTTLIENGILRNYMYDKLNARLMHTNSTGNGRRSSYATIPIPRMTNTFMLPGKYTSQEIISSVTRGIYAVNFSGGQVDITSGEFVFATSEAYLIENGKVTHPLKGVTLIGNGPEILNKITMVGNDLELDGGIGTCGKNGQNVPVGIGQPTIKISGLTVGGTII